MKKIVSFDLNKLYIVTDFDHTITTFDSQNCWGVLSKIPGISKEYIKESKDNNNLYYPIEQDDNLNYEEKNKKMKEWYQKHAELLIKYQLKESDLIKICEAASFTLRKGVKEFLYYTYKNSIPIIIVSAGISRIIESVLKNNNCLYDNIYIISNIFKFQDNKLKSVRNKIIHSLNKNKVDLPKKVNDILKDKDEAIIIGDNISDSYVTLKELKKTYKIGFLNYNNIKRENCFKKHFDIILKKNNSFLDIIDLINTNLKNKRGYYESK